MADKRSIAIWVLAVLGSIQFFFAGITKVMGTGIVDMIHNNLGTPYWMLTTIGVVETIGAAALLWPKTRWYAAEVLAGIVFAAAIWHLVKADWGGLPAALIALAITGTLSWLDRPEWFRQKFF